MVSQHPLIDDPGSSRDPYLREITGRSPLVTIACVTLNAANHLKTLLKSVREHRNNDVEFIIIDGGSTDGTLDLLRESPDIVDFWISRPDDGIYDAMNTALNYVQGKWVLFMGADDHLLEGFDAALEELKNPYTIYYGNLLFHGKRFDREYDDYYLTKLNICQQCIFYPAAVFDKYRFDLKYRVYADYNLNLNCWSDPRFKFKHINHLICHFSDGGFSSFAKDEAFEKEKDILFKKNLRRSSYYRYLNRTVGLAKMISRFLCDA